MKVIERTEIINHFDDRDRFVLEDFDRVKPFSSFLPGIAGLWGSPLWVFYVNRGQGIASFGVESKDKPILEFYSANQAYQRTPIMGFRTFIKRRVAGQGQIYEPFAPWSPSNTSRQMTIGMNELQLSEESDRVGLRSDILYFTLTNESMAGLVRHLTVTNTSITPCELELFDGLPAMIPYGVDNHALKNISRTLEAWMQVDCVEAGTPFYRLRASSEDTAEVTAVTAGHYAMSVGRQGSHGWPLAVVVDPTVLFGQDTSLVTPVHFCDSSIQTLLAERQITGGKTPCAFFAATTSLAPGESFSLTTLFGYTSDQESLPDQQQKLLDPTYVDTQYRQATELTRAITDPIATKTGWPIFDSYCRQTFLDNVLRGGLPAIFDGERKRRVYYMYARKHGDPERDYNDFLLPPEPFSQGNGNYRDIAQNRRCDVFFQPDVGDHNIRLFLSLIQADGYNPLVIRGTRFVLADQDQETLLEAVVQPQRLASLLAEPFTPGELVRTIRDLDISLRVPLQDFLGSALHLATQQIEADFGEGFWIDHWTYLLDLIEAYQGIYPDRMVHLLYETALPYFDSPATIQPRRARYVVTDAGPRQLNAVIEDEEKAHLIASRPSPQQWVRSEYGRGEIFTSTVIEKLFLLALIKVATRDPWGMGLEMEAGKPGWYDALNGLPGLFGSSMPETYELLRLVDFLLEQLASYQGSLRLPEEGALLLSSIHQALDDERRDDFDRWQAQASAREHYRARTRLGFSGDIRELTSQEVRATLSRFRKELDAGIARAQSQADLPPTYFSWGVSEYAVSENGDSHPPYDALQRPLISPLRWQPHPLPSFLEGPTRLYKTLVDEDARRSLYQQVHASPLFDSEVGMYCVNTSLAVEPYDIGRARAFTAGWLENQSIWLHMHYKYLLELLRGGLFQEFFQEIRRGFVPFLDPMRYGRSPLENSSFLVSSAHPDPSLHGSGFVARLTGATAEFLHMWTLMMAGPQPFFMEGPELRLHLRPALAAWLFDEDGCVSFSFLGRCQVIYHNPDGIDLFGIAPGRIVMRHQYGETITLSTPFIGAPYATQVRQGEIRQIDVYFSTNDAR